MIPAKKCSRTKDFFRFHNGHIKVVYVCSVYYTSMNQISMTFLHSTIYIHQNGQIDWKGHCQISLKKQLSKKPLDRSNSTLRQATITAWITLLLKSSALSITSTTRPRSLDTRPGNSQSPPIATLPILSWIFLSSVPSFAATCS